MSFDNGKVFRKSCDRNYCFFIQDFIPGDCLIVKERGEAREKGVVERVDHGFMRVEYKNAEGTLKRVGLDDIVLLQSSVIGWLD